MGTFSDSFNDGALDTTNFGTSTNNNGTVTESLANSRLEIDSPAVAADAAIAYYKSVILSRSNTWATKHKFDVTSILANASIQSFVVHTHTAVPVVDTNTNWNARSAIQFRFADVSGTKRAYFGYKDSGGTFYWWNDGSSIWQSGFAPATQAFVTGLSTKLVAILECDGVNFTLTYKDENESSTLWGPATIAVGTPDDNGDNYLVWGDPFNNLYYGQLNTYYFEYTGPEIATTGVAPTTSTAKRSMLWRLP